MSELPNCIGTALNVVISFHCDVSRRDVLNVWIPEGHGGEGSDVFGESGFRPH